MSVNIRTAASVIPSVLVAQYVPTTGAAQYQPASLVAAQLVSVAFTNTDTVSRTVTVSIVKSGGTAGGSNTRLPNITLTAGQTLDLGEMMIGDGDFIWAQAGTASTITVVITGSEFSNATGSVMSGIQTDAVGSGGHGAAGSASETIKIGTGLNRRLVTSLLVQEGGAFAGWASYTGGGPTVNCGSTPMTRKVSIDFNNGGNIVGSAHLFVLDSPPNGTQTISAAAAATGATMGLVMASKSYSGVDLTAGLSVVSNASATAAPSLAFTTATGHVPVLCGAFYQPPQALNMNAIRFDGITSGFTVPQWLIFADMFGAPSLTATTSNTTPYAAVGFDMSPA